MSSSPEPHQQQHQEEEQQRDLLDLPIAISSSPPTLDLLVLEEKAEALRTDLLLRLEEMTNQMREAFDEASKTLFDSASEWEQQAIDALKTNIQGIKELEHEHKVRQEQLARFVRSTSTSFADIFKYESSKIQSPSPSSDGV